MGGSEVTIDKKFWVIIDMEYFKKVIIKYRTGFRDNFSRIKVKCVVHRPAMFGTGRFVIFC